MLKNTRSSSLSFSFFRKRLSKGMKMYSENDIRKTIEQEQLTKDDIDNIFKKMDQIGDDNVVLEVKTYKKSLDDETIDNHANERSNKAKSFIQNFVNEHPVFTTVVLSLGISYVSCLIGEHIIANGVNKGITKAIKNTTYLYK